MGKSKETSQAAGNQEGEKNPKKPWKKPELKELDTSQTHGGAVANPVDTGSRNPS